MGQRGFGGRYSNVKQELDTQALYAAVESKKSEFGLSWAMLAMELELDGDGVFTRMAEGHVPDTNTLLTLTAWLGSSLDQFVRGDVVAPDARQQTMDAINSYLRADEKALAPESAEAITSVLRAAYLELVDRRQQASKSPTAAMGPS